MIPFWSFGLEIHTVCWMQKSQDGFWEIAFSSLLQQRLAILEKQSLGLLKYQGWGCFTKMNPNNMELHTTENTQTPCQGVRILSYLHDNLLTWPRKSSGAFSWVGEVWMQGSPACGESSGRVFGNPHILLTLLFSALGSLSKGKAIKPSSLK